MLAFLAEAGAFGLAAGLLAGSSVILGLADHMKQVGDTSVVVPAEPAPNTHNSSHSTVTVTSTNGSIVITFGDEVVVNQTVSGMTSNATTTTTSFAANVTLHPAPVMQGAVRACRKTGYRSLLTWIIVNMVPYTLLLISTLRIQYRRMRRAALTRKWLAAESERAEREEEIREFAAQAGGDIELRQLPNGAVIVHRAEGQEDGERPEEPPRMAWPPPPQPPRRPELPPNLRQGGTMPMALVGLEVMIWFSHFWVPMYAASVLADKRMPECHRQSPVVWGGCVAVVVAVWVQFLLVIWLRPSARKRCEAASRFPLGDTVHYATDGEGRAVRPRTVRVVSYVPRASEWSEIVLPYPAHEIKATDDDTESGPECAICYDEFNAPVRDIWRGRLGNWIADPLWLLPCGHVFHEQCCAEWFSVSNGHGDRCPYCNQDTSVAVNVAAPAPAAQDAHVLGLAR